MLIAEGVPRHVSVGEGLSQHRLEAKPVGNSFQSMPTYAVLQGHTHKPHTQLEPGDLVLSRGQHHRNWGIRKVCNLLCRRSWKPWVRQRERGNMVSLSLHPFGAPLWASGSMPNLKPAPQARALASQKDKCVSICCLCSSLGVAVSQELPLHLLESHRI